MGGCDVLQSEIRKAHRQHQFDRPFVVAVDGLSGSGKTTLARQLKADLASALIIHIDDHIVERKKRYGTGNEEWIEYYQLQWDTIFLKENLFEKLHQNIRKLDLPFYDKEKDCSAIRPISLNPDAIVLIEGVFLLREEWKAFYDYIIFLDCPREERNKRVLQRDTYIGDLSERVKKYQNRYWKAEDHYLEKQKPFKFAHHIHQSM